MGAQGSYLFTAAFRAKTTKSSNLSHYAPEIIASEGHMRTSLQSTSELLSASIKVFRDQAFLAEKRLEE